jgi:cobalt/nickel transport system permease protein
MHMADALLSPVVGGTLWAAAAGAIALCSRRVEGDLNDRQVPFMGVLGAFVFAVQMINFTIPGTGSSGHLGGGMILAILLGPAAALITIASVLTVQALFFADGGLLALGCNIFNLGIIPCFIAYPLVFKRLAGSSPTQNRIIGASILSSVLALQLGAFAVVLETFFSGISALPFRSFALVMQPVHLPIGIVEGVVTAMVVSYVWKIQPESLTAFGHRQAAPIRTRILAGFLLISLVAGGGLSWMASTRPDGLEWAISQVAGSAELEESGTGVHWALDKLQQRSALLPGYAFRKEVGVQQEAGADGGEPWPFIDDGSAVSAVVGGTAALVIAFGVGLILRKRNGSS